MGSQHRPVEEMLSDDSFVVASEGGDQFPPFGVEKLTESLDNLATLTT